MSQETESPKPPSSIAEVAGSGIAAHGYVIEKEPPVVAADVQVAKAVSAAAARLKLKE